MIPFLFSDGSILNLWNNCRWKLCQSLPMQYMGLWLQARVLSFELLLPNMCKEERKQRQRSTYRSFTWSETPMENIVGIGLSTLKVIVLFPIGSSRNVFLESYILKLLLILCTYININDVFFFQILHMTSQNNKHFTKSRKLTLALIMRPLIVTKKMAIANDSPSK